MQIDGDRERVQVIIARMPVPDPGSGGTVHFDDDPERWARFPPAALRGPYLTATCAQQFPTSPAIKALNYQANPSSL